MSVSGRLAAHEAAETAFLRLLAHDPEAARARMMTMTAAMAQAIDVANPLLPSEKLRHFAKLYATPFTGTAYVQATAGPMPQIISAAAAVGAFYVFSGSFMGVNFVARRHPSDDAVWCSYVHIAEGFSLLWRDVVVAINSWGETAAEPLRLEALHTALSLFSFATDQNGLTITETAPGRTGT